MSTRAKVHASPISSSSDIVMLTIAEGGLTDYDYVSVDLGKQENRQPEFLAINPKGKVPVLTTPEGDHICECRAITQYLAARYKFTHLVPPADDVLAMARFNQAMSSEMFYFNAPAEQLLWEAFVKALFFDQERDEAAVASALARLESHLDQCNEVFKAGQKFMAGDTFSLVDIAYIPLIASLIDLGFGDVFTKREGINGWWQRCLARPATRKFVENIPKLEDIKKGGA